MLDQLVLASIERGLNSVLQTDVPALKRLAALSGRVLEFRLQQSPHWRLFILPHAGGISLAQNWQVAADCCLSADAATFIALANSTDKRSVLHRQGTKIDGNSALLVEFSSIIQDLQLDWEYLLQQWLGPVASSLLAGHIKQRADWLRLGSSNLLDNLADYLAEESRLLVGRKEAKARFADLDELKLQLDRLQARVDIISQRVVTA